MAPGFDNDLDSHVGFITKRFSDAINANNQEALALVFEPNAILVPVPGTVVRFSELKDGGSPFSLHAELGGLHIADDLAMLLVEWVKTAEDGQGNKTRATGRSTDIARRDGAGVWRCIIDNGYGGGPPDATRSAPGSDHDIDNLTGHMSARLREAISKRDSQALASCFEPAATVVTRAGSSSTVQDLEAAFEAFTSAGRYESAVRHSYTTDGTALVIEDWSLATGQRIEQGTGTHVGRRGADGQWRYVIYNSPGTAPYRDSTEIITG